MGDHEKIYQMKDALTAFLRNQINIRIKNAGGELKKLREGFLLSRAKLSETTVKLLELEDDLRRLEKELEDKTDFAENFERLMRIEKLRMVNVVDGRCLVLKTKSLLLRRKYDIGQFNFKIDLLIEKESIRTVATAISFSVGPYKGEYIHPDAGTDGTTLCFGNNFSAGLNADILKNLYDLNVVALAHLILSFLEMDEKEEPRKRNYSQENLYPADVAENEKDESGYASEEERENEKAAFIRLLKTARENKTKPALVFSIERTNREVDEQTKNWLECRREIRDAERKIGILRNGFKEAGLAASNQAQSLLQQTSEVKWSGQELIVTKQFENIVMSIHIPTNPVNPIKITGIPSYHRIYHAISASGELRANTELNKKLVKLMFRGDVEHTVEEICIFLSGFHYDPQEYGWEG